jgi:hypothetical protein
MSPNMVTSRQSRNIAREFLAKTCYASAAKKLARVGKDLSELRGKNLACYCPIGQPCHADLLVKLANKD